MPISSASSKSNQYPNELASGIFSSDSALESLGLSDRFLFDLDDTLAIYDKEFIIGLLLEVLQDHTIGQNKNDLFFDAMALYESMHYGHAQKDILEKYFDSDGIRTYWDGFTALMYERVKKEHVHFDPRTIKFINFIVRNSIDIGVISNSNSQAGTRVLDYFHDKTDIELHPRSVFLGSSPERKPNVEALKVYERHIGDKIDTSRTSYIGNAISDLVFATNIGSVPVLLDSENRFSRTTVRPMHQEIINSSVVVKDFGALKNHLERVRPNYRRQVSFLVEKSLSEHKEKQDINNITLNPTEENIYRVANEGTDLVVSHIPRILRSFNEKFRESPNFSIISLPDYAAFFHEATGANKIPSPIDMSIPIYKEYFGNHRIRYENGYYFTRGPLYFRQYIESLINAPEKQDLVVSNEIIESLNVLLATENNPQDINEYLMRLGVLDNFRGNLLSIFLSTINLFREGEEVPDLTELKGISEKAKFYYEKAVELQYCLLLGLECNVEQVLLEISEISELLDSFCEYNKRFDFILKHKNPEIDHQINIAMRANEACDQYPNNEVYLGLSSGGVELATVSWLISSRLHKRDTELLHYPISTHHGLTMWQSDKRERNTGENVCEFLELTKLSGKNVLICEDNSNSGQTLDRAVRMAKDKGANKVNFAVIELDPTRVILHSVQQKAGSKHNIGEAAKRTRPIANYFHPDFVGAVSIVKILPADQSFSKVIAIDTANKYEG